MSRSTGTFNFSANFEPRLKAPLDARQTVNTFDDLTDPSTWTDSDGNVWLYDGAVVGVAGDDASLNGIYLLLDADNYTLTGSWVKSSTGTGSDVTGENVGSGDASVFSEKLGSSLRFRTLKGGTGVNIDVSGNEIIIDASGSGSIYESTLDPSLSMPSAVGGYIAGTKVYDLLGDSFTTFVDNLLFPTVDPTYVAPDNIFVDNVDTLQEIGNSLTITYTSTFGRGQILINSTFQNYRSGLPVGYSFTDPSANTLLIDSSSSSLTNIQSINGYAVNIGTQTWTNAVAYATGPQPLDNKGAAYGSPLPAGMTTSKSVTIEGVHPLFGTTSSISTLTQQTLVSMLTGNNIVFSMVAESGGNKQRLDIPDSWSGSPTSRPLVGIQTYNTVSSQWEYQGGSAASSLTYWTTTAVTHVIQSVLTNYTRYQYNGTDRSSIQIRLVF